MGFGTLSLGALSYFAGRHLYPSQPWLWVAGILASTLSQGFINRIIGASSGEMDYGWLSILAMAGFGIIVTQLSFLPHFQRLFASSKVSTDTPTDANPSQDFHNALRLVGTACFAFAVALGLLIFRSRGHLATLAPLALPMALLGSLIMAIGLYLQDLLQDKQPDEESADLESETDALPILELAPSGDNPITTTLTSAINTPPWQPIVANSITILGCFATIVALAFGKSQLPLCAAVAVANVVATLSLSRLHRQALLTLLGIFHLSLATWLLAHLTAGSLPSGSLNLVEMRDAFLSPLTVAISSGMLILLAVATGLTKAISSPQDNSSPGTIATLLSSDLKLKSFTDQMAILTGLSVHALITLGLSLYLGYFVASAAGMITAGIVLTLLTLGLFVVSARTGDATGMILVGISAALLMGLGIRGNSALALFLHADHWTPAWRIVYCLVAHCLMMAGLRALQLLPLLQPPNDAKTSPLRVNNTLFSADWIATCFCLATGVVAGVWMLRWDHLEDLGWQAGVLAIVGITLQAILLPFRQTRWGLISPVMLAVASIQAISKLLAEFVLPTFSPETVLTTLTGTLALGVAALIAFTLSRPVPRWLKSWRKPESSYVFALLVLYHHGVSLGYSALAWNPATLFDNLLWSLSASATLLGTMVLALSRRHRIKVQIAAAVHVLIATVLSIVLAYSVATSASMLTAAILLSTLTLTVFYVSAREHSGPGMFVVGVYTFVCVGMGLNPVTDMAQQMASHGWDDFWRCSASFLLHSLLMAVFYGIYAILQRVSSLTPRHAFFPAAKAGAFFPSANVTLTIASSITSLICAAGMLRWDRPQEFGWQAGTLAIVGLTITSLLGKYRKTKWGLIPATLVAIATTLGTASFLSAFVLKSASPESVLALVTGLLSLVIATLISYSRLFHGPSNWLRPWREPKGVFIFLAILLYHHALSLFHSPRLFASAHSQEGVIWGTSFGLVLLGTIFLALWYHREIFQWIAGGVVTTTLFVWMVLVPTKEPYFEDFLHILALGPLLLVLGFSLLAAMKRMRPSTEAAGPPLARELSFEWFVTWGTLITLSLELFARHANLLAYNAIWTGGTLERPLVYVWYLVALATIGVQTLSRRSGVSFVRIFLLSLVGVVYLPILVLRLSQAQHLVEHNLWLSIIAGSVAVHAAIVVLIPLRTWPGLGHIRSRCLYPSIFSVTGFALFFMTVRTDAIPLQILALAIFLARSALVSIPGRNECHPLAQRSLRYFGMIMLIQFATLLAWSNVQVGEIDLLWGHRLLRLASILFLGAIAVVWRKGTDSSPHIVIAQARRDMWLTAMGGAISSIVVAIAVLNLNTNWNAPAETVEYSIFGTKITGPAPRLLPPDITIYELLALVVTGIFAMATLIVQAVKPRWDALELPEAQRSSFVFMAELIAALLTLHIAFIFPFLFDGVLRQYWPFVILGIAMIGAAVSEILKRTGVDVVSRPLFQTAAVLPFLVGILAFVISSSTDKDHVLILVAIFYFILGAADGSRQLALIGGAFANLALFFFWKRFPELDFTEHPQLWLIPPALSVLIATHVQRNRLPREAIVWIRYVAMGMIFFSSSSEIFLSGFGKELWPPMVLMVLSVLAVLTGIGLQVRSFLFFGLVFVLVSMTAMVAHAQQSLQHTWPWWVLGISLGIGILVLFGLFEKKREEIKALTDRLRSWDG